MHYRHSFHAGNFADVFKHVLLCALLRAMNRKYGPWLYLDTHAGAGRYDLLGAEAQRSAEWRDGIGRLYGLPEPDLLGQYLAIVRRLQRREDAALGDYPGSPLIAAHYARPGDRVVCFESAPDVALVLEAALEDAGATGWALHRRNGYESAFLLPPPERRGLVLIDPPFEQPREFEAIGKLLTKALARFAHGVYAVWYPFKHGFETARFLRRMGRELPRPAQNFVFENGAAAAGQMHACGLLIVNPPYRFEAGVAPALDRLVQVLAQGPRAGWRAEWTKAEDR